MSITAMFKKVGAPLANARWSWGGVREDGAVFLRVWQDEWRPGSDQLWMRLTHHQEFVGKEENLGYQERNRHVELIRAGAPCYLIMCAAQDIKAVPRVIKSFDARDVFVVGAIEERDGDTWAMATSRKPA